jgi:hypothetical protein
VGKRAQQEEEKEEMRGRVPLDAHPSHTTTAHGGEEE